MVDRQVKELEEAKAALAIMSKLSPRDPVPAHVEAIIAMLARAATALEKRL